MGEKRRRNNLRRLDLYQTAAFNLADEKSCESIGPHLVV